MAQQRLEQPLRGTVKVGMRDNASSKVKDLRMAAARMHRGADQALRAADRERLHRSAQALDVEADGLAEDASREALFGVR
jgi:hypothetical protein